MIEIAKQRKELTKVSDFIQASEKVGSDATKLESKIRSHMQRMDKVLYGQKTKAVTILAVGGGIITEVDKMFLHIQGNSESQTLQCLIFVTMCVATLGWSLHALFALDPQSDRYVQAHKKKNERDEVAEIAWNIVTEEDKWQSGDKVSIRTLEIMETSKFRRKLNHYRRVLTKASRISNKEIRKELLEEQEKETKRLARIEKTKRTEKLRSEIISQL